MNPHTPARLITALMQRAIPCHPAIRASQMIWSPQVRNLLAELII
ncbi:hypothetical protein AB0K49_01520 [Streptomyces decoyicus]